MSNKSKFYTKTGVIILAVIAVFGIYFHNRHMENDSAEQVDKEASQVHVARQAYDKKKTKVKHELFGNATQSKDPIIRTIAVNGSDSDAIHAPFLKFFNVYYNWNSNAQYSARARKLKSIATFQVLHNKKYFDSGLDSTGGKFIDNEQLNDEFNNLQTYVINHSGSNVDVLADVQYNSWHSDTDNQGTGEKWFEMNYNLQQKKITSMKTLYTDTSVKNDND